MTISGLAIFYGGLVRAKNVLSVLMQCLAITSLVTVLWIAYGYGLAFGLLGQPAAANAPETVLGGLSKLFLRGVTNQSLQGTVPETIFITFPMTFAIITPALIVGAFAERMKFSAMLWFTALWLTLVYLPVCQQTPVPPHSLTLTVVGTGMLWVGWFGFYTASAGYSARSWSASSRPSAPAGRSRTSTSHASSACRRSAPCSPRRGASASRGCC
jgi:Amt family ammonium transporter